MSEPCLGADLKLETKGEMTWTRLRVATNNGRKTQWFWVTVFGKLAENMVEHLAKGEGIASCGSTSTRTRNGWN